jgi:hypothetical protein
MIYAQLKKKKNYQHIAHEKETLFQNSELNNKIGKKSYDSV